MGRLSPSPFRNQSPKQTDNYFTHTAVLHVDRDHRPRVEAPGIITRIAVLVDLA